MWAGASGPRLNSDDWDFCEFNGGKYKHDELAIVQRLYGVSSHHGIMITARSTGFGLILIALLFGVQFGAANAQGKSVKGTAGKTARSDISHEMILLLIRTTIIALDQANKTGDYSVLRKLGGPGLQRMTPEQLSKTFESLRAANVDLAPASIVTPELSKMPAISQEGRLSLMGFFPTRPSQIQFRLVFEAVGGVWKPFGLSISLAPATEKRDVFGPPPKVGKPK